MIPDDINTRISAIIEGAIQDLIALGMERQGAIRMLAVQAIVRLGENDTVKDELVDLLGYTVVAPPDEALH